MVVRMRFLLSNSFFVFNEAATEGGAIHCYKYGRINIEGGYSISNSAVNGKGGFAYLSECSALCIS